MIFCCGTDLYRKSRTAINGSFYVLRHKPDFCELFAICGGRLVFLREENDEGFVEDDRGFMLAKLKEKNHSIKNWLGKKFAEIATNNSPDSPSLSRSNDSPHQWEKCCQEIEQYVDELLSLHEHEGDINGGNAILNGNSTELRIPENMVRFKILLNFLTSPHLNTNSLEQPQNDFVFSKFLPLLFFLFDSSFLVGNNGLTKFCFLSCPMVNMCSGF